MIGLLRSLDERVFRSLGTYRPRALVKTMRALTHLGDAQSWIAIGLFLICCGGHSLRFGLLLGTGAVLATLVSQVLKRACCRPRPSFHGFVALIEDPDAFSFPSGHAAAAFAVAIALAGQGAGLGPLTFVLAGSIGFSRVYLGAHYPLDVAAGALIGCACGGLARFLVGGF
ncbi:MAG TPA: phosphatase PAP2 family protein [Myxococcales bacterium]|jgi:undecaprenyl-diphosphatase|nr:phosphatase PAP2 family protein [Myxococcales bacterium]